MPASETPELWPLLAYAAGVIIIVIGMVAVSYVLGERHRRSRAADQPFESGMLPTGDARLRVTAKFYLIAMFFVIFDLEAVFIFAWVIAFGEVGWAGFIEMAIFIGFLLIALVYLWREGALDWGPERKPRADARGVPSLPAVASFTTVTTTRKAVDVLERKD